MTYSDYVALILVAFLVAPVVITLACWGIAMLVADWRHASRHKRRITAIINLSRF